MARTIRKNSQIIEKRGSRLAGIIQQKRQELDLTQEELSAKAKIKLDTLRSVENGRISAPNVFLIADIAKILDGDLNEWLK